MTKMMYQKPMAEFVVFENEDIITASTTEETCPYNPGYWCDVANCPVFRAGSWGWCDDQCFHENNGHSGGGCFWRIGSNSVGGGNKSGDSKVYSEDWSLTSEDYSDDIDW